MRGWGTARQAATAAVPGVLLCAAALLVVLAIGALVPGSPALTMAVFLGVVAANVPVLRPAVAGVLAPGLRFGSRTLLRLGVVLLGFAVSFDELQQLGVGSVAIVLALVVVAFAGVWAISRASGLPGDQPLLMASGYSICGASAVAAMSAARHSEARDTVAPLAMVTLCGTLSIAVLPLLMAPLGLTEQRFGFWVGASVHDVGQVVATAQIVGATALTGAVLIKLVRVLMLAPLVIGTSLWSRRTAVDCSTALTVRAPVVPIFIVGFAVAVAIRTLGVLEPSVIEVINVLRNLVLAMALFALGTGVDARLLRGSGGRVLTAGIGSWIFVAALAWLAVQLIAENSSSLTARVAS